jgi:hypothetical protein
LNPVNWAGCGYGYFAPAQEDHRGPRVCEEENVK